ncbi:MAG: ADP-ribosylglycohydrolase family protein [Proteobacteria bacterium]|nr:ADP-ribosylglycohydrolase family protein [Pseudomonadota bacterium]
MLWAAYGDALGFISELADPVRVERRIGTPWVDKLVAWKRRVGGRLGVDALLPEGTYSDDTQLRLATCRAIRGDGVFDMEVLAKVELPVWLSYALGAGRGTTEAATALSRPSNAWMGNFFSNTRAQYINGGGNGAAMRIQPHVWATPLSRSYEGVLLDVLCNAIITHGHPRAWVGAAFHALSLRTAMKSGTPPGPDEWSTILERLDALPQILRSHDDLNSLWAPLWEQHNECKLDHAIRAVLGECKGHVERIGKIRGTPQEHYEVAARAVGAHDPATRGAGTATSILASLASWLFRENPRHGLQCVVNLFGTDTDTIATMAGAVMGVNMDLDPPDQVQDARYLCVEADRLATIAQGRKAHTLRYPDLLHWQPPATRLDAVGSHDGALVVAGFGPARPVGEPIMRKDTCWQWMELQFGQRVFIKRRRELSPLDRSALPVGLTSEQPHPQHPGGQQDLFTNYEHQSERPRRSAQLSDHVAAEQAHEISIPEITIPEISIDEAYEKAYRNGFDAHTIGALLRQLSEQRNGVDRAVAFAALVARAINEGSQPARKREAGSA